MGRVVVSMIVLSLLSCGACRSSSRENAVRPAPGRARPEAAHSRQGIAPDILNINDTVLTADEVLKPLMPEFAAMSESQDVDQLRPYIIEQCRNELIRLIQDILLYQEASKDITEQLMPAVERFADQEIKDRINREFGGRETRFEAYLADRGETLAQVHERTRRNVIIRKYLQENVLPRITEPTRRELLDYYQSNLAAYSQPEVRELSLIDIPRQPDENAARDAILRAKQRLDSGENFEAVARDLSRGIHAADGGYWGTIRAPLQGRYEMPSSVFFKLSEQEVSDIIESPEGFFIVKSGRIEHARTAAFSEVQAELVQRYRDAQFETFRMQMLRDLLERAVIEPDEDSFLQVVVSLAIERLRS